MANNNAIGFALEIPDSVFSQLDKAQRELDNLEKKSASVSSSIVGHFQSMANGVNPFIAKMQEARNIMSGIEFTDNSGVKNFASSIVEAANALNRIGQTKSPNNLFSSIDQTQIQGLNNYIKKLQELSTKEETRSQKNIANSKKRAQQVIDNYNKEIAAAQKAYNEKQKMYDKLWAQQEREQRSTVSGSLSYAQNAKTYTERAKAIKYLETAIKNLDRTDAQYEKNLKSLSTTYRNLQKEQRAVESNYKTLSNSQHHFINTTDQLKRAVSLVFSVSQIRGYIAKLAQVRGEFELQNRALQAILQNKEEADRLFGQITELAVKSPFQLKELVTYTKQLAAYRVESEKLFDTTKMLADVSAGLGVDMQRLILAYGQVKAANYLRGTELRQFSEAGINILGELATYFTEIEGRAISVGEVFEMVSKRMVSFQDVENIFKRITSEGGIFYNMQEIQADTLAGMISNMQDSIDIMLNELGTENEGLLKGSVALVREIVENWRTISVIIKSIGGPLLTYKALSAIFVSFGKNHVSIIKSLQLAYRNVVATVISMQRGIQVAERYQQGFNKAVRANVYVAAASILIGVITAVVGGIREANRAQREFNKTVTEGLQSADQLSYNFKRLADTITDVTASREEQNAALKELQNTYQNLLPAQTLTIESLKAMKGEYDSVTNAIYAKIDAQTREKLVEQISENEYQDVLDREAKLVKNIEKTGVSKNYAARIVADLRNAFNALGITEFENYAQQQQAITQLHETLLERGKYYSSDQFEITAPMFSNLAAYVMELEAYNRALNEANNIKIAPSIRGGDTAIYKQLEEEYDAILKGHEKWKEENKDNFDLVIELDEANKQELVKKLNNFIADIHNRIKTGKISSDDAVIAQGIINQALDKISKINISDQISQINDYRLEISKLSGVDLGKLNVTQMLDTETFSEYVKRLEEDLASRKEVLDVFDKAAAKGQTVPELQSKNLLLGKDLEEYRKEANAISSLLDKIRLNSKEISEAGSNKAALDQLKEQISFIEKLSKEYKDLRKEYSATEADAIIKNLPSFKETAKALGLEKIFVSMSFDANGILNAFKQLTIDGSADLSMALQQAIEGKEAELSLSVQINKREQIEEEIQSLFEGYQLSIEFEDLGTSVDQFKSMLKSLGLSDEQIGLLNLNTVSFDELITQLKNRVQELRDIGSEQSIASAIKTEEQITEIQLKEAQKRLKELFTLREKYNSNQEKVSAIKADISSWEAELARLEDIERKGEEVNQEQKELLELRIQNGKDTILQLESEALQLTDFWRTLFGDLEDLSVNSLRQISSMVDQIISNRKEIIGDKGQLVGYSSSYTDRDGIERQVTLTTEQYQRLLKQNNKVADEIQKKNPFVALFDAIIKGKNEGETNLDYITRLESNLVDVSNAAFDVANNLADIFGGDEDTAAMLENIKGIADGAISLGTGIAKIASGNPAAIITGAISAVGGIANIIKSIGSIGDNKKEQEIERQMKLVENLERSYEKLYETIENGLSIDTYSQNAALIQNLRRQIDSYQAMIAAERDKKNSDSDRINEWQNSIDDLYSQINDLYDNLKVNLIGDFKSISQELGDAIAEAFSSGTDAATAWGDTVNEIIADIVKNIAIQKYLEPQIQQAVDQFYAQTMPKTQTASILKDQLDTLYDEYESIKNNIPNSLPGLKERSNKLKELEKQIAIAEKEYDNAVEASMGEVPTITQSIVDNFVGSLDSIGESFSNNPIWDIYEDLANKTNETNLSGLQKGIQDISETTAQALESLLNSIRFYVADNNTTFKNLYNQLFSNEDGANPMLAELRIQTRLLTSIDKRLAGIIKSGHSMGSDGVKVFI